MNPITDFVSEWFFSLCTAKEITSVNPLLMLEGSSHLIQVHNRMLAGKCEWRLKEIGTHTRLPLQLILLDYQ
jgi:hypothetical protein